MKEFDFYKELYFEENRRSREMLNSYNIPIAIITALTTVLYFFITNFNYNIEEFLSGIFILSAITTGLSILIAIFFLIKAFSNFTKGYEYSGLSYPKELYDWKKELDNYYEQYGSEFEEPQKISQIEYEKFIIETLVEQTEENMYINDKKHSNIYLSKKFLIVGLVLTLLTLIPFGYNFFKKNEKIYKVELTDNNIKNKKQDLNITQEKLNNLLNLIKSENYERRKEKKDTTTTTSSETKIDKRGSRTSETKK